MLGIRALTCSVVLASPFIYVACSTGEGGFFSGSSGGSRSIFAQGGASYKPPDLSKEPPTPGCADGVLDDDEACDDGNTISGDGCLANCKQVEWGYSCSPAGQPCRHIARCGDGVVALPELCDDGNTDAGDGCSPTCKFEVGYKCTGSPSDCTPTTCGDGKKEGAESCEESNAMPYDGCSSDCQSEPTCSEGVCTSTCGDGIVLDEDCDDGNNINGDGCSEECRVEEGFACEQPALGDRMLVPMVVRDFNAGGDFEKGETFAKDLNYANQGLVRDKLEGGRRKPVLAANTGTYDGKSGTASGIASPESFAQWYDDAARGPNSRNKTLATKLPLYLNTEGTAYVNRYGNAGDGLSDAQYMRTTTQSCGQVGKEDHNANGEAIPCTVCYFDPDPSTPECDQHDSTPCQSNPGYIECVKKGTEWQGIFALAVFDGNPTFFPADSVQPFNPSSATQISGNYDPAWPAVPGNHNFSFTTEVRYWFKYQASTQYRLSFIGDDDVWVFINNRLAVDLGGIHTAVQGELILDRGEATAVVTPTNPTNGSKQKVTSRPNLELSDGKVYEIVVFQAERQTKASSYQLTLSGFSAAPSECTPLCGDGIVGIGEECDDGVNDGGYGECGPGCRLSEYCGDGIVQENEDCDDGVNIGSPCDSGCRDIFLI